MSPLDIALIAAGFGRQKGDSLESEAKILQNKQKNYKMISLCVVFVMLSLTVFTVISPTSIIAANTKNSGYEFNVEKSEDGTEADIVGQASKGAAPGEVEEINWGWRDLYGLSVVEICGWLSAGKTLSYLDKACLLCLIN